MMKISLTICAAVGLLLVIAGSTTAVPTDYYIWNNWGGTWADAEKVLPDDGQGNPPPVLPGEEDDWMCWAAVASNVLEWTGWGKVGGMTNTDQMFKYFQDHWTDDGGLMEFGWEWWFTGTNPSQGWSGWSQVDVPGGGFYPALNFNDYFHESWSLPGALSAIDQYLHAGYGTGLAIYDGGHAITCWGFRYDPENPNYYTGIWVSDSDDDKTNPPYPDTLRYYDVKYISGAWYLQNFYGTTNYWYIEGVQGLEPIPEPATICLLGLGALSLLRKKHA